MSFVISTNGRNLKYLSFLSHLASSERQQQIQLSGIGFEIRPHCFNVSSLEVQIYLKSKVDLNAIKTI
jgi:hypothetical protein